MKFYLDFPERPSPEDPVYQPCLQASCRACHLRLKASWTTTIWKQGWKINSREPLTAQFHLSCWIRQQKHTTVHSIPCKLQQSWRQQQQQGVTIKSPCWIRLSCQRCTADSCPLKDRLYLRILRTLLWWVPNSAPTTRNCSLPPRQRSREDLWAVNLLRLRLSR